MFLPIIIPPILRLISPPFLPHDNAKRDQGSYDTPLMVLGVYYLTLASISSSCIAAERRAASASTV